MEVTEFIEKDKKIVTISLPLNENFKIQISENKVIFERLSSFDELSKDVKKYLKKDYLDEEIDVMVKDTRSKLWKQKKNAK